MSQSDKHILSGFTDTLRTLRDDVLIMGSYALRGMDNGSRGLFERDSGLCNLAIDDDEEIDELEKKIDETGVRTLVRFTPVAADLREVISAMKIAGNLERVGDQAVTIARRGRRLNSTAELNEISEMAELFRLSRSMLSEALRCYGERDVKRAAELIGEDRLLDDKCHEFDTKLGEFIKVKPDEVHTLLNLIFISRSLERIGDHASNIAEDVIFLEEGRDVRYSGIE